MPVMSHTSNFVKYDMPPDKGNHVKLDTHTWRGVVVDTWKMDEKEPYLQMVGYFNATDGEEVLLLRKDIPLVDVTSHGFFIARRQFICDLASWSFHGFADNLHWDIKPEDLEKSRKVIDPGPASNAAEHETKRLYEKFELGGKWVYFELKSLKKTNGPFMQRLKMYVLDATPHVRRQFLIDLPVTKEPFVKLSDYFEQYKTLISETLGLKGKV